MMEFRPSVLLSETHNPYLAQKNTIRDALTLVADRGFFRSAEFFLIDDPCERKDVARIAAAGDISILQWMGNLLYYGDKELSPCDVDELRRRETVATIQSHMAEIAECGTSYVGINSGSDPGADLRKQAKEQLYKSLCQLCTIAEPYGIEIVFEPFDREAHKKGLIGPTDEAVEIIERIRCSCKNISLCWDSSHAALNGEDLPASLKVSQHIISRVHFANPVLDAARDDYGDYHIPFGQPGAVDVDTVADLLRDMSDIGLLESRKLYIAVEVRTVGAGNPLDMVNYSEQVLQKAWDILKQDRK